MTGTTPAAGASTNAYYLIESDGALWSFAGAPLFGSASATRGPTRIVAAAAKPGGGGYWLLSADGALAAFGAAAHLTSPGAYHHAGAFAGLAVTPDGKGLVAVTARGSLVNEGSAPFCGSLISRGLEGSAAGVVLTPDGDGYWIFTAAGTVYGFGDAPALGSVPGVRTPLVGLAPTADGKGYWLAYADGAVSSFGDAPVYGSIARSLSAPVVSIGALRDGEGYWLVNQIGQVYSFGKATYHGGLSPAPPAGIEVVALVPTRATATSAPTASLPPRTSPLRGDPFIAGSVGYDLSGFQCNKHRPSVRQTDLPSSTALAVVQVTGWLDGAPNPCLSSLLDWARAVHTKHDPDSLYLFMNAPTTSPGAISEDSGGPAGSCARLAGVAQALCRAYNYGYNGAMAALRYANANAARSSLWWLDIEGSRARGEYASFATGAYWSSSRALNDRTIQGAIDALRKVGVTVGIYSASIQYANIAGDYVPPGPQMPLWIAGVPWTNPPYRERGLPSPAVLSNWCAGRAHYVGSRLSDVFAGGVPWLLQETPGNLPSPHGLDPDYAC